MVVQNFHRYVRYPRLDLHRPLLSRSNQIIRRKKKKKNCFHIGLKHGSHMKSPSSSCFRPVIFDVSKIKLRFGIAIFSLSNRFPLFFFFSTTSKWDESYHFILPFSFPMKIYSINKTARLISPVSNTFLLFDFPSCGKLCWYIHIYESMKVKVN